MGPAPFEMFYFTGNQNKDPFPVDIFHMVQDFCLFGEVSVDLQWIKYPQLWIDTWKLYSVTQVSVFFHIFMAFLLINFLKHRVK